MSYNRVVGNDAINATGKHTGETLIDLNTTANKTTTLTKAYAYCSGTGTNKIKIFRDDGTNYNFIGEVQFTSYISLNTIPMNISVQSGDLIGWYIAPGDAGIKYGAGTSVYKSGDITTNSAKSTWSAISAKGTLNAGDIIDYYVKIGGNDGADGRSWANAWATINKAATTVPDDEIVHIGFGDYVNEPAANKIAPQNIGASGIYYLPETADTGGGTGTVSIEQNA